jgi:hypothetical protein
MNPPVLQLIHEYNIILREGEYMNAGMVKPLDNHSKLWEI